MPRMIIKMTNREQYEKCCQDLLKRRKKFRSLKSLNSIVVTDKDLETLDDWLDRNQIERIDEDLKVSLIEDEPLRVTSKATTRPWGLSRIGTIYSRIPTRYTRPRVAIIDTGIRAHPLLSIQSRSVNFSEERQSDDLNGHGTHLAGTIAAKRNNGSQSFHGIYPNLSLYNVKAFQKDGTSSISNIVQSLEWCVRRRINVINMSFGLNEHHPALYEAIRAAYQHGISLVAAAGNDGDPGLKFPARYPEVTSVGSTGKDDQISTFSQFGAYLDVVAPGEKIVSTWLGNKFRSLSGTSMSAAHVTGVLALLKSAEPQASIEDHRRLLISQCERLPASNLLQGNGLISWSNIFAQLRGRSA